MVKRPQSDKSRLQEDLDIIGEIWKRLDPSTRMMIMGDLIKRDDEIKKAREIMSRFPPEERPAVSKEGKIITVDWQGLRR